MENIKDNVIRKIILGKKEIKNTIKSMNYKDIDQQIFLYKSYESLNLFQELFYLACDKSNNNIEELCTKFKQVTKNLVDSCNVHLVDERSSWTINLETYKIVSKIIKCEMNSENIRM